MLKRKIYDKLLDWKNKKSRECLLVQGARQIGKTFIIEAFGRRQYKRGKVQAWGHGVAEPFHRGICAALCL